MTLARERENSIRLTREFLRDLLDPKKTPRVPKAIRRMAYYCLKHYPADYHINDLMSDVHNKDKRREDAMFKKVKK